MAVLKTLMHFTDATKASLPAVAKQLLAKSDDVKVWLFVGEMGAGKTTLVKELCKQLGVSDTMSSPTFSIVNEYHTVDGKKVFHFDFYRIQHQQEAIEIGIEEYFFSGNFCFIEWPERIPSLLPDAYNLIHIETTDKQLRTISMKNHG